MLAWISTGRLVPPAEVDRLFQPFQRASERAGHDGGHGLGLAIAQAIAAARDAGLTATPRPGGLDIEVRLAAGPAT